MQIRCFNRNNIGAIIGSKHGRRSPRRGGRRIPLFRPLPEIYRPGYVLASITVKKKVRRNWYGEACAFEVMSV